MNGIFFWCVIVPWIVVAAVMLPVWVKRERLGWQLVTYLTTTLLLLAGGLTLVFGNRNDTGFMGITYVIGCWLLGLSAVALLLGLIEFGVMPVLGQFRLGAIARVTYYEALLQPFTIILLFAGLSAIAIMARLSFFTYNEDFKMYRDVASSFVFLFTLPVMIFASTKVIDEEIENRTMLTLMSKPVSRWQVILGKYLGVLLLVFICVATLGILAADSCYLRYFDDMNIDYQVAKGSGTAEMVSAEWKRLDFENFKAFMAFLPAVVLTFLQLATLAAISVAVSTRFGLAANVTTVVVIYIAASMAQFAQNTRDLPPLFAMLTNVLASVLPSLGLLDLNQRLVFGNYIFGAHDITAPLGTPGLPTYTHVWQFVGIACVYSVFYIGAALALGMALFRSRELT